MNLRQIIKLLICSISINICSANALIGNKEFVNEIEDMLGVTFSPERMKLSKRDRHYSPLKSAVQLLTVTSGGIAATAGIKSGDYLLSVNGNLIRRPNDFMDEVEAITHNGEKASIEIKILTPSLTPNVNTYPKSKTLIIPKRMARDRPQPTIDKETSLYTRSYENINGTRIYYFTQRHTQSLDESSLIKNESDDLVFYCKKGCDFHVIHSDGSNGKKYRSPQTGSYLSFYKMEEGANDKLFNKYKLDDALIFLPNLSKGDLQAISMSKTDFYKPRLGTLYFWFAKNFGRQCKKNYKTAGKIEVALTEVKTIGYTSNVTKKIDIEYEVEKRFLRLATYFHKQYVDYSVISSWTNKHINNGISELIATYGCGSKEVNHVRKSLFIFGEYYDDINYKVMFNAEQQLVPVMAKIWD